MSKNQSADAGGTPDPVPLSEVLAAAAERIHYAEGRRTNFTVVAGALMAGGIAVLTFIVDKQLARTISYPATAAALGSIVIGIVLLIVYARQTNRYPWTAATNTWKWFYRDALPDQARFDPKWWTIVAFGSERKRLQDAFAEQLPTFLDRLRGLENKAESLDQDAQQLYVLHINEKFKNVHLSQLRSIFQVGVVTGLILVSLSAGIGAWSDHQRLTERNYTGSYDDLWVRARWRFISVTSDDQTVLVNASVINLGRDSLPAPAWVFLDDGGTIVPTHVTATALGIDNIPSFSEAHYTLLVRPAENMPVTSLATSAE